MPYQHTSIEPTTTITIDETVYNVSELSDDVQRTIKLYDSWRQRESEIFTELAALESELICIRSAKERVHDGIRGVLTAPPVSDGTPSAEVVEATPVSKPAKRKKTAA